MLLEIAKFAKVYLSIVKIRMVYVSRFFVNFFLPKSLWATKTFENSYQRV